MIHWEKWKNRNDVSAPAGKAARIANLLSLPLTALGSAVLYFVIEALSRHSFGEAWTFMTERPWVFSYNAFLIFTTFTIVYLTRRRAAARLLLAFLWLLLGVVNSIVLANRVTPFTGPDLKNISDGAGVVTKYMSGFTVVLSAVVIVVLLLGILALFVRGPRYRGRLRWYVNLPLVLVTFALLAGATNLALARRVLSNYFVNIAFAYEDYGYPYCLMVTFFETGITEPTGYSEELMTQIEKSMGKTEENDTVCPNLVFLQLESFFDPLEVNFLELSEDPIPNFRRLMKEYSSGYFRVPVVGAGTANSEFEIITGMSLRYFGPGEYPYKSVLKEETCESVPYVLKDLGYSTHAIHNNEANFYSRKTVFSRLGFDDFISEEYMPDISDVTATGWVKDHILTDEILKCLNATEGRDYIYTISVQGHGDYPTEPVMDEDESLITVTGAENMEKNNDSWQYYVNQLREMDLFIQELTETLAAYEEPVVLVMYGDHLPTMNLRVEDLKNRYLYQTEYVIWDNMGLQKRDENIASYQIAAEVLNRVGIHSGNVMRYHQTRKNTKNYQVDLEALQYDILYGDRYIYGLDGDTPYKRTKLQLGVLPVQLFKIEEAYEGTYYFYGKNFTASSRVEIDGELMETFLLSPKKLMVQNLELEPGTEVCIAQQSNSPTKKVLSRSAGKVYQPLVTSRPTSTPTPTPSVTPFPVPTGEDALIPPEPTANP